MRDRTSLRPFGAGILLGVLVGSSGVAGATFGAKMWATLSPQYKVGYLTGFLDMANIARNLQPGGYVDARYPLVPNAPFPAWRKMVDSLYEEPANQEYTITSILQVAARRLEEKYGKAAAPSDRVQQRMLAQLDALRKKQEAAGLVPTIPPIGEFPKDAKVVPNNSGPAERGGPKRCRCDDRTKCLDAPKRDAEDDDDSTDDDGSKAADASKAPDDSNAKKSKPAASPAGKPAPAASVKSPATDGAEPAAPAKTTPAATKPKGAKGDKAASAKPGHGEAAKPAGGEAAKPEGGEAAKPTGGEAKPAGGDARKPAQAPEPD